MACDLVVRDGAADQRGSSGATANNRDSLEALRRMVSYQEQQTEKGVDDGFNGQRRRDEDFFPSRRR